MDDTKNAQEVPTKKEKGKVEPTSNAWIVRPRHKHTGDDYPSDPAELDNGGRRLNVKESKVCVHVSLFVFTADFAWIELAYLLVL